MQDALRAGWERKERAGWGRGALTWPWEREGTREMIGNNLDSGANGDGAEGRNGGKLELQPSWAAQRKPLPRAGAATPPHNRPTLALADTVQPRRYGYNTHILGQGKDVPKQKTHTVHGCTDPQTSPDTKTCKHGRTGWWILRHARNVCVDMHRQRNISKMHTGRNIMKEPSHGSLTAYHGPGTVLGTTYMLPHLILQTSTYNLGGKQYCYPHFTHEGSEI